MGTIYLLRMYYRKLNKKFNTTEYHRKLNPRMEYCIDTPSGLKGMIYYDVNLDKENFEEYLPKDCKTRFSFVDINSSVPVHIDLNVQCAINFYFKTDKCVTHFYEMRDGIKIKRSKGNYEEALFFHDYFKKVDKFIAKIGDIVLLDVTKPHSVKSFFDNPNIDRKFLSIQIENKSFEQVTEHLINRGFIDG